MKDQLKEIQDLLNKVKEQCGVREVSEINFQMAQNNLQKLIDAPEHEPAAQASEPSEFEKTVLDKLDGFEDALGVLVHALPGAETPAAETPAV